MTIEINAETTARVDVRVSDADGESIDFVIFPTVAREKVTFPVIIDNNSGQQVGVTADDLRSLLALIDEHVDLTEPPRWTKGDRVLIEVLADDIAYLWQRGELDRWTLVTGGPNTTVDEAISNFVDGTAIHIARGLSRATVIVQQNAKEA